MKIISTRLKGLKILEGQSFFDNRGYFREVYRNNFLKSKKIIFWSISESKKNVVRGLHLQNKFKQAKLVTVVKGKIFDVALDLRKNSKIYGKYYSSILSEKNSKSLYIPIGFAHGFCSLENHSLVIYGMSNYRSKKNEVGIIWNDKSINIKWPIKKPIVSKKDKNNITLKTFNNLYR